MDELGTADDDEGPGSHFQGEDGAVDWSEIANIVHEGLAGADELEKVSNDWRTGRTRWEVE